MKCIKIAQEIVNVFFGEPMERTSHFKGLLPTHCTAVAMKTVRRKKSFRLRNKSRNIANEHGTMNDGLDVLTHWRLVIALHRVS